MSSERKVFPVSFSSPEIDWSELFGNRHPVEVEIGSGKGAFLLAAAESHPGTNYFGIENQARWVRTVRDRLERRNLPNARILCADATLVVSRFVRDDSVRAYHLYFPDPWWKRRHQKRRVIRGDLVPHLYRTLEARGTLYLATDVAERFDAMLAEMRSMPFEVRSGEKDPDRPLTNFERKYREQGRALHYAALRKPGRS